MYLFAEYFRDTVLDEDPNLKEILDNLGNFYVNKNYDAFIDYFASNSAKIFEIVFNSAIDEDDYIILLYCLYNNDEKTFKVKK